MTTIKDKISEKALSSQEYITAVEILNGEVDTLEDLTREERIEADRSDIIQYDEEESYTELYLDEEVYSWK